MKVNRAQNEKESCQQSISTSTMRPMNSEFLPSFRLVPFSCFWTISQSEEILRVLSPFSFTASLEWLETDEMTCAGEAELRELLVLADITGWETFGVTAQIKSSGLDWSCFLEGPSVTWTGLVDLRSTLTRLVPLSGSALDWDRLLETGLIDLFSTLTILVPLTSLFLDDTTPRRRANLDSESCNLFSASSSCNGLS